MKILGNGELGSMLSKVFQIPVINRKNMKEIENSIIINCTPASALPEISQYNPKLIINCCKGIYKNKTTSDYFPNTEIISVGGYYKAKYIPIRKQNIYLSSTNNINVVKFLSNYFNVCYTKASSKEIEMSGVLKNIYLLGHEKYPSNYILDEVITEEHLTNNEAISSFIADFVGCKLYGSRNAEFSTLFYKHKNSIKLIQSKLKLIEGLNALNNYECNSSIIQSIRDDIYD